MIIFIEEHLLNNGFSFFDEEITIETKQNIVEALKTENNSNDLSK